MKSIGTFFALCFLLLFLERGNSQAPFQSTIAFTCRVGNSSNICLINTNGKNLRNLTAPFDGSDSVLSSDGTQIFFASERDGNLEIYRMDASGKNPVNLTRHPAHDMQPHVSPNGKQLVFRSKRDPSGLYLMNADGSHLRYLTTGLRPAWSPDGRRIAFYERQDIWVIDVDGQNRTRLTQDSVGNFAPAWSPDGRQIAFGSWRDWAAGEVANLEEIYVMDATGENKRRLTHARGIDSDPVWSPDGKQIAFDSQRDEKPRIYMMNADGRNQKPLTPPEMVGREPDWFDPNFGPSQGVEPLGKWWTVWGFLKQK